MQNKINDSVLFYCKEQRKKSIDNLLHKKNLTITILGYGLTGKSFLQWAQNNLHSSTKYFIIDTKNKKIINDNKKIIFLPECYKKKCFKKSHFILPSPGFLIQKKEKWYWKIIPELDLFFYMWNKLNFESIIITGSIGKTSLTTMIYHYISKIKNTILCGNIGYPVLNFLNNNIINNNNNNNNNKLLAIIECSNLQLEHCVLIKVNYFMIINLFENHLNMHRSYQAYILAKLSPLIFEYQYINKIIMSENVYNQINIYFPAILKKINKKIILASDISLPNNNKNNANIIHLNNNMIIYQNKILLSTIPAFSFIINWQLLVGILYNYIKDTHTFIINNSLPTLPDFRLQKIIDTSSIIIYNDSKSTIIESSISALDQILLHYKNNYYIIFMIGGLSKGVDRSAGINIIVKKVNQLILFGAESKLLKNNIIDNNNSVKIFSNLLEATQYTIKKAQSIKQNTIIIFSPGGSSFDEFDSYIDRGNKFNNIIKNFF